MPVSDRAAAAATPVPVIRLRRNPVDIPRQSEAFLDALDAAEGVQFAKQPRWDPPRDACLFEQGSCLGRNGIGKPRYDVMPVLGLFAERHCSSLIALPAEEDDVAVLRKDALHRFGPTLVGDLYYLREHPIL